MIQHEINEYIAIYKLAINEPRKAKLSFTRPYDSAVRNKSISDRNKSEDRNRIEDRKQRDSTLIGSIGK